MLDCESTLEEVSEYLEKTIIIFRKTQNRAAQCLRLHDPRIVDYSFWTPNWN